MSNVEFEQHDNLTNKFERFNQPKGLIGFLIKKHIVKDVATANIVLLIFALVVFGVSVIFWGIAF